MEELYPELHTAALFEALFEGNPSRYGTEEGGSIDIDADWSDLAELHLAGEIEPLGVYPIDPDTALCKWGCIDFDDGEDISFIHAANVTNMLQCVGIKAWVERSRSKGYHVWVFSKEWVTPATMRAALLYACEFMDAPTTEINPKQLVLKQGQVGNYVRLPYPGHLYDCCLESDGRGSRRMMVSIETGYDIPLATFVREAWDQRTPPELLEPLSARWVKAEVAEIKALPLTEEFDAPDDTLLAQIPRKARRLFENGSKFPDRSAALCYLAGEIVRENPLVSEEDCKSLLVYADANWGKYTDRPDVDVRLNEIVERAFNDKDSFY